MKSKALAIGVSFAALAGMSACGMLGEDRDAAAGGSTPTPQKESFSTLDKDNDGMVSRTEAAADADAASRFEKLDANKDERLSRSEYEGRGSAAGSSRGATGGGSKY